MKIRNLLVGFVLATMILFAGSFQANTTQAFGCTNFCINYYNSCVTECNGNQGCVSSCHDEYVCCYNRCSRPRA
jgi:hypothetical protein